MVRSGLAALATAAASLWLTTGPLLRSPGCTFSQGRVLRVARGAVTSSSEVPELFGWLQQRGGHSKVSCQITSDGLRGLATCQNVRAGEVLLEVPLSATLGDGTSGAEEGGVIAAGPSWAKELPWNIQLALGVLERRAAEDWKTFLSSWPTAPPLLPKDIAEEDLEEAQDEDFEIKAGGTFFWLENCLLDARQAYQSCHSSDFPWSDDDFRWAVGHVWSRVCRFDLGPGGGTRRLLVPVMDLGNHVSEEPSAVFEYCSEASCGAAVCLFATRDLVEGEAVTYSYGDHPNEHFLMYYGFVPLEPPNPHEVVYVDLLQILNFLPADFVTVPSGGWVRAVKTLALRGLQVDKLPMRQRALPRAVLQGLRALLARDGEDEVSAEQRTLRAIAFACRALEAEQETSRAEDEELLRTPDALSPGVPLLVRLRLGKKRLLLHLAQLLEGIAQALRDEPEGARRRLVELVKSHES